MNYRLVKYLGSLNGTVKISASKSECNRGLLINVLMGGGAQIGNISNARDSVIMTGILQEQSMVWDVRDAGTAMRFLTAYLGVYGIGQTITGTDRMKERPIYPLVDALRVLGAQIEYLEKDGNPPMRIYGIPDQLTDEIRIPGNISSQYISALLMIAPCLPQGLKITLTTEIFSKPYIRMTLDLMSVFGVRHRWIDNNIAVDHQEYVPNTYTIESDWSGAGYWYGFVALNQSGGKLCLPCLREKSFQGDQAIVDIMKKMGVVTIFSDNVVNIHSSAIEKNSLKLDFKHCPDLAQTVMVIAAAKGISLEMTGLESLKIKETDRVSAMRTELRKIGAILSEYGNTWHLTPSDQLPRSVTIDTYDDHRMAMAFAPLSQLMNVVIRNPNVVQKSYPDYWDEIKRLGVNISADQ